jgi:hypothetical protein
MGSTYSTYGENDILCKILAENVKETTLLDARMLVKRHLKKLDINFWDGYVWMGPVAVCYEYVMRLRIT